MSHLEMDSDISVFLNDAACIHQYHDQMDYLLITILVIRLRFGISPCVSFRYNTMLNIVVRGDSKPNLVIILHPFYSSNLSVREQVLSHCGHLLVKICAYQLDLIYAMHSAAHFQRKHSFPPFQATQVSTKQTQTCQLGIWKFLRNKKLIIYSGIHTDDLNTHSQGATK